MEALCADDKISWLDARVLENEAWNHSTMNCWDKRGLSPGGIISSIKHRGASDHIQSARWNDTRGLGCLAVLWCKCSCNPRCFWGSNYCCSHREVRPRKSGDGRWDWRRSGGQHSVFSGCFCCRESAVENHLDKRRSKLWAATEVKFIHHSASCIYEAQQSKIKQYFSPAKSS